MLSSININVRGASASYEMTEVTEPRKASPELR